MLQPRLLSIPALPTPLDVVPCAAFLTSMSHAAAEQEFMELQIASKLTFYYLDGFSSKATLYP